MVSPFESGIQDYLLTFARLHDQRQTAVDVVGGLLGLFCCWCHLCKCSGGFGWVGLLRRKIGEFLGPEVGWRLM